MTTEQGVDLVMGGAKAASHHLDLTSATPALIWTPVENAHAYHVRVTRRGVADQFVVSSENQIKLLSNKNEEVKLSVYAILASRTTAIKSQLIQRSEVPAVDFDQFADFNTERLPIIKFEQSPGTVIVVTNTHFTIKWASLKRGRAVQLRLYDSDDKKILEEPIVIGKASYSFDISAHLGHTLKVYGRILFDQRWGKWVECCGFIPLTEAARDEYLETRRLAAVARNTFLSERPSSPRANVEQLLKDIGEKRVQLRSFPTYAILTLGYDCNIDCKMCDEGRVRRPHHAPRSLVDDLLENCLPLLSELQLIGGEPLLYKETDDIARRAEAHPDLCITFSTNATLLTKKWQERIAEGNYRLVVSIDGATSEIYERIRRKSSFTNVIQNLIGLRKSEEKTGNKTDIKAQFVIQKDNVRDIEEMVRLASRIGISRVHFNLVEYPQNDVWMRTLDPIVDLNAALSILDRLRRAIDLGHELGVDVDTRAIPRIVNMYPSLAETPEEAWSLPYDLELRPVSTRADMARREAELTKAQVARIQALRNSRPPGTSNHDVSHRLLPEIPPELEEKYSEALRFLRQTSARAFCDFPFTRLNLDTYRTYVCCMAQDKYLYGSRFEQSEPTIYDIWNGEFIKSARQAMFDGRFDEVCHTRCHHYRHGGTYENLHRALGGDYKDQHF